MLPLSFPYIHKHLNIVTIFTQNEVQSHLVKHVSKNNHGLPYNELLTKRVEKVNIDGSRHKDVALR